MIHTEHFAYCDNPQCDLHGQVGLVYGTRKQLRDAMREDGWGRRNGQELCPECVAEVDRAKQDQSP